MSTPNKAQAAQDSPTSPDVKKVSAKSAPAPIKGAGIHQKILNVIKGVNDHGRLNKSATTEGANGFKYVPIEVVKELIRPLLVQEGLVIITRIEERVSEPTLTNKRTRTILKGTFEIVAVDSPTKESIFIPFFSEGADVGDFGLNKALANATKYLYMVLFQVSAGEEIDADSGISSDRARVEPSLVNAALSLYRSLYPKSRSDDQQIINGMITAVSPDNPLLTNENLARIFTRLNSIALEKGLIMGEKRAIAAMPKQKVRGDGKMEIYLPKEHNVALSDNPPDDTPPEENEPEPGEYNPYNGETVEGYEGEYPL
jgi:hypothetical protein